MLPLPNIHPLFSIPRFKIGVNARATWTLTIVMTPWSFGYLNCQRKWYSMPSAHTSGITAIRACQPFLAAESDSNFSITRKPVQYSTCKIIHQYAPHAVRSATQNHESGKRSTSVQGSITTTEEEADDAEDSAERARGARGGSGR